MEAVALHDAGEPATLGRTRNVHQVPLLEELTPYLLADLPLADIVHSELPQVAELPQALHVALQGGVNPLAGAEA